MTIGSRLKRVREMLGFTQKDMANFVGCSLRSWASYENNENLPGGDVIKRIADAEIDLNWLISGKTLNTGEEINIYNVAFSAGAGTFITDENIESQVNFSNSFFKAYNLDPKHTIGVRVSGDSMENAFFDNDTAIIDTSIKHFIGDAIYAFCYDDCCYIKMLQLTGEGLFAISLNQIYPAWKIEQENLLRISGMVKAGITRPKI